MILRKLLALLLIGALEMVPVTAVAASITITDPYCSDFMVSGPPGALSLTCSASGSGGGGTTPPPPPPPPAPNLCTGYEQLREDILVGTGAANVADLNGYTFGGNTLFVVKVTTPTTWAPKPNRDGTPGTARNANVTVAEHMAGPAEYLVSVSKFACDFRPVDPTGKNGPLVMQQSAYPSLSVPAATFYPGLVLYVNIKGVTCTQCGVIMYFSKP